MHTASVRCWWRPHEVAARRVVCTIDSAVPGARVARGLIQTKAVRHIFARKAFYFAKRWGFHHMVFMKLFLSVRCPAVAFACGTATGAGLLGRGICAEARSRKAAVRDKHRPRLRWLGRGH